MVIAERDGKPGQAKKMVILLNPAANKRYSYSYKIAVCMCLQRCQAAVHEVFCSTLPPVWN